MKQQLAKTKINENKHHLQQDSETYNIINNI